MIPAKFVAIPQRTLPWEQIFVIFGHVPPARTLFCNAQSPFGWLGSRVVSVLDSGAEGLGSNRSRRAVG